MTRDIKKRESFVGNEKALSETRKLCRKRESFCRRPSASGFYTRSIIIKKINHSRGRRTLKLPSVKLVSIRDGHGRIC